MAVKLQLRRDTTANWSAANPILAEGEVGIDTTLRRAKIGDGATAWNSLGFGLGEDAVGIRYAFDTATTDSDPGTGVLRFNNATLASATTAFIDNADIFGTTLTAWLDSLDDSTSTTKGTLRFQKQSDASVFREYSVSGTVVDGGGYRKITLSHMVGNGAFSSGDVLIVAFSRTGNQGASGGGSGDLISTNNLSDVANAVTARANLGLVIGTHVQAQDAELSAIAGLTSAADKVPYFTGSGTAALADLTSAARTLLDDASVAAMATTLGLGTGNTPQFTGVELGHATDTTLARIAAGRAGIEGKEIITTQALTLAPVEQEQVRLNISAPLRGYLWGGTLSNNVSDPTNDIDIAVTFAASTEANPVMMILSPGITKRLDAAWAVGTGNGGRDTGSIADGTWHVWIIRRSDTGVTDVLFSLSASSPTMPTNYDQKRRIGSIIRTAGAIRSFAQIGDMFRWGSIPVERSSTAALADALFALTVPTGIIVWPIIGSALYTNSGACNISNIVGPGDSGAAVYTINQLTLGLEADSKVVYFPTLYTNTSAQIRYLVQITLGTIASNQLITLGYMDRRGQDGGL